MKTRFRCVSPFRPLAKTVAPRRVSACVPQVYAIKDLAEATAYLQHPVLSNRLIEICNALLQLSTNNAHQIFGSPDDVKLKSSMTLFASVPGANPVFEAVLKKYFNGAKDERTLALLKQEL